jgi:quercetin dioxygenase-like cupin family protein
MPFGARAQEAAKPAAKKARAVFRAASELKWKDIPNGNGAQEAVVWGHSEKGAHGSFAKFAAGTEVPLHTHTAASRSVVISGTMREALEGQQPKELGPGSYFAIPGRCEAHDSMQGRLGMRHLRRLGRRVRPKAGQSVDENES